MQVQTSRFSRIQKKRRGNFYQLGLTKTVSQDEKENKPQVFFLKERDKSEKEIFEQSKRGNIVPGAVRSRSWQHKVVVQR